MGWARRRGPGHQRTGWWGGRAGGPPRSGNAGFTHWSCATIELAAALRTVHTELSGGSGAPGTGRPGTAQARLDGARPDKAPSGVPGSTPAAPRHTAAHPDPLEIECRLPWLLTALARRHGTARPMSDVVPGASRIALAVRDRLADELLAPPSLAELAACLGLSRYQVLRAFRVTMGMPPYAWLAQYRVARARKLLDLGHRPAEAAGLTGFADQAHLTRWFRRVMGVTPAAYRAVVLTTARTSR